MQELFKSKTVRGKAARRDPYFQTLLSSRHWPQLQPCSLSRGPPHLPGWHMHKIRPLAEKFRSLQKAGLQALFGKFIFSFEYTCCEFRLWLTLEITIAYLPLCTVGEMQTALKAKPCPGDLGIKDLIPSVFTSVLCTEDKRAVFQHLLHLRPQAQPGWKQSKAGLKGDRIPVLITHVNALSIDSASADQSA